MWTGPPIDEAASAWQHQPQIAELVAKLAQRRLPQAEAEKIITDFLATQQADKRRSGTLLFAGLFDTLNRQRSTVMDGIERTARKQRAFAAKIRADAAELRSLQSDEKTADPKRLDELTNQVTWETRIYEDRQQTISYVCEVPQQIERRLFALSRTIEQALD